MRVFTYAQLVRRVEYWRAIVVPEWRVCVMAEPSEDAERIAGSLAHVQADLRINEIRVYFEDELRRRDRHEIDRVIVHELIHPLLDRVLDHDEVLDEEVSKPMMHAFRHGRIQDEEEFVNRMAHLIVDPLHGVETYRTGEQGGGADDPVEALDEKV